MLSAEVKQKSFDFFFFYSIGLSRPILITKILVFTNLMICTTTRAATIEFNLPTDIAQVFWHCRKKRITQNEHQSRDIYVFQNQHHFECSKPEKHLRVTEHPFALQSHRFNLSTPCNRKSVSVFLFYFLVSK